MLKLIFNYIFFAKKVSNPNPTLLKTNKAIMVLMVTELDLP